MSAMSAALIKLLAAKGLSLNDIVEVIEQVEADTRRVRDRSAFDGDEQAERRRAADRDRKRTERECLRKSADNPQTSADTVSPSPFPLPTSPTPPSPNPLTPIPIQMKEVGATPVLAVVAKERPPPRRKPEIPLPDDWEPGESVERVANELGFSDERCRHELAKLREHAGTHDRRCRDWDRAACGWLRKAVEFEQRAGPSQAGGGGRQDGSRLAAYQRAFSRV